jgi:hypothetical protein
MSDRRLHKSGAVAVRCVAAVCKDERVGAAMAANDRIDLAERSVLVIAPLQQERRAVIRSTAGSMFQLSNSGESQMSFQP